jgi:lipopolysaccharide/colanic/teichoic acid biosynthesis glycosyltransferase
MQRFFDLLFSAIALLVLAPLFIPVVILLKFTGEGEVFFLQERVGLARVPFKLYKFATMLKDSPNMGTGTVTMKNDPRVLPWGNTLRKTKINELPQLLNVFKGDMSLVGPRPQSRRCFDAFPADTQEVIVKVKPGLSGVGPIVFRGEEDILEDHAGSVEFYDTVIAPYKGKVEAWYVDNQTLSTYFSVIFITVWVVLFPRSRAVWKTFKGLPTPPDELKVALNFS